MKRLLHIFLVLTLLLSVVGWVIMTYFPNKLIPLVLNRQLQSQMAIVERNNKILADKESIYIITVGTASPMPGERVQTGTAIIVNGHFFMFDVGDGVVQKAR